MRLIQQQIEELNKLDVPLSKRKGFDSFWTENVNKVNTHDHGLKLTELPDYPLDNITVYDSVFHGLDGTPVKSWVLLPEKAKDKPVPAILWYHGGNGSRGTPLAHLWWLAAGFAVVTMDFRQQGGQTGSNTPLKRCGADSFAVMNIEEHKSYYLYHAWTDGLTMIKAAQSVPEINPNKIAVAGTSQGGGTSLVMSALNNDIALCMAAVPSYCWWERRIFIRSACASQISRYIERNPDSMENVFNTMSYFDAVNFVEKIKCPVMVSCGFKDEATPPDCVYSAYNKIKSEKYINNYPAGAHTLEPKEYENWLRFARRKLL